MKVALLVLAAALVLGGLVGVLVARDPGYVLVAYQNLAVETSLWFALLVLVVAYLLVRLAAALVLRLVRGGGRLKGWTQRRRERTARDQTVRGLLLMAEGRWSEARKLLQASAARAPAPLINHLAAARAAHELGDERGRDAELRAAHESTPGSRFAIGLTQAELQLEDAQWEPALATLLQLRRQAPRHPQVLCLLARCYRELGDWQAIIELGDDLKKHRAMAEPELRALQLEAWRGRLTAARGDVPALWKAVPRELRRDQTLVGEAARAMVAAGADAEAENLLRESLEQEWSAELVRLYGSLTGADAQRRMVVAEGWLKQRPNDPDLLLALGRISLLARQWAKAREYLEASLRLRRSAEAQAELGRLCLALGETDRGAELLIQSREDLPALPLPPVRSEGAVQGRGA